MSNWRNDGIHNDTYHLREHIRKIWDFKGGRNPFNAELNDSCSWVYTPKKWETAWDNLFILASQVMGE